MDSSLQPLLEAIDADKAKLDTAPPLPLHTLESLRQSMLLDWTYNSNAIAGNSLTQSETKTVLDGIAVGGKLLREHFEVLNHREAMLYVEERVGSNEPFSESQIRHIHHFLLKGIDDKEAGQYRHENVTIAGASTKAADFSQVPTEMAALIAWHSSAGEMHPIERAARLHARFEKIHPFSDGNGRAGRLLLNLELMKSGYPPAVIRHEHRLAYCEALDKAGAGGDFGALAQLVAEAVQRTLEIYLNLLGRD
ncbi:Fic family protein [Trinickia sp.]|uniref:Fic family protein n=1 Tax=Trinickia sp. TaxID=2571163 RepID=UPI003F7D7D6F